MDDPHVLAEDVFTALDELSSINRWLGGYRVSRLGIGRIIRSMPHDQPITVLDVGAGGTDLSQILAPLCRTIEVTAVDRNPVAGEYARKREYRHDVVVASAHSLPFRERSFDIAHASLFLHHCSDDEVRTLLASLARVARRGIVINDLHRHPFAFMGISLLVRLLARSALVRHDAPTSVLRGFRRAEFASLLPADLRKSAFISWHWAFRWCVCIDLTGRVQEETDG